jgi:hypothetical protein
MSSAQDEFRQQLLGYVYGELKGDELAAFEAQLASSEEYQRELASMRETLQLAREGLSALAEAAPPRLHGKLIALADAREAAPRKPSFWAWLRNPSLIAVAGLATIALLAVVSRQNPFDAKHDRVPIGEEPKPAAPVLERNAEESQGPGANELAPPAPTRETPQPATHRKREASADERRGAAAKSSGPMRDRAAPRKYAEPPPARDDQLAAPSAAAAESVEAAPMPRAEPAAPKRAAANGGGAYDLEKPSTSRFAQPPPAAPTVPQLAPDQAVNLAREHAEHARWQEAALAYRELLRRYPDDPRKSEWQRELDLAKRVLEGHNSH